MHWSGLAWVLPDEALVVLLVVAVLGLMLGLVSGRVVGGLLVLLVALPIVGGVAEMVLVQMPAWVTLIVLVAVGFAILRGIAALLIGQRAADTMTGNLAADVVRLVAAAVFLGPFRLVRWAIRMGRGPGQGQ